MVAFLCYTCFVLENQVQASFGDNVCVQGGRTFSYECTVTDTMGIGLTIWMGDAFHCMESSDEIRLNHRGYDGTGLHSTCGNFSAISVGVNGSEYTSRLTFFGDVKLNGTTINCTLSDVLLIETIVVKIEG